MIYKIIFILAMAGIAVGFIYSVDTKMETKEITLLKDVTDTLVSKPEANKILDRFNLSSDKKWDGAKFRVSVVSDVSMNTTMEYTLIPKRKWYSNEFERETEIKEFRSGVLLAIDKVSKEEGERFHSSVYLAITNELLQLNKSKSYSKELIVYSDLMENTTTLSFYDKRTIASIQNNPNVIIEQLKGMQDLPDLNDVTILFIYQPVNIDQDIMYRSVSRMYKAMLESKGATVEIVSNI